MNHPREEELALYSTGDLEPDALNRFAAHMKDCPRCRECLSQFQQVERMLAAAAAAPDLQPDDLQEVRERVMLSLPAANKPRWRFEWAAGIAALIALLILLSRNPHSPIEQRAKLANSPSAQLPARFPSSPVALRNIAVPRRSPGAPGLRSIALVTHPDREPLIRIVTADPKVLILLPANAPNDERTESNE